MDITMYQITKGTDDELIDFKNTLINYISNKKYSTKSITLLKTLKKINQELEKRENDKLLINTKSPNIIKDKENKVNQSDIKEIKVPSFLSKCSLLSKKRSFEKNEQKKEDNDFLFALEKSFSNNICMDDFSTNDSMSLYSVYFPSPCNGSSESCSQSIFSLFTTNQVSRKCNDFDISKLRDIDEMWVDSSSIYNDFHK